MNCKCGNPITQPPTGGRRRYCSPRCRSTAFRKRHGMIRPSLEERFYKFVEKSDGCWLWTGGLGGNGYGLFWMDGATKVAHRVAYQLAGNQIDDAEQLDHLCRNRACVNPSHVEPVSCRENLLRGQTHAAENAAKTHCPNGHAYDDANTYYTKKGARSCRACHRDIYRLTYLGRRNAAQCEA